MTYMYMYISMTTVYGIHVHVHACTLSVLHAALFHGQLLCDRPMKLRMDSSSPYQPDPMQLRLSGLAGGATPTLPVPPPPPPPPMPPQRVLPPAALVASLGEATPTNPLSVPLLTSVITSLAAEKLAAMLLQNGALSSSGAPGLLQQQLFTPPPLPHLPVPQIPTSLRFHDGYGAGRYRCVCVRM